MPIIVSLRSTAVALGDEPYDDDWDHGDRPPMTERVWRHPAEVAMEQRRRRTRRRRTRAGLAAIVCLGTAIWVFAPWETAATDRAQSTPSAPSNPQPSIWAHDVSARARASTVAIRTAAETGVVASAVALHEHGYLVTSGPPLGESTSFVVVLDDGSTRSASLLGADPPTGIAVLVFDGRLPLADITSGTVRVGDPVAIVTAHDASSSTVSDTAGVADTDAGSALVGMLELENTTAASAVGGPVVAPDGTVIGITVATTTGSPLVAVPIDIAARVARQLIDEGVIRHPWLGVRVSDHDGRITVRAVSSDGPAAASGLLPGDHITAIDGAPVTRSAALVADLRARTPGTQITVLVERAGASREHVLRLATTPTG